MQYITPWLAACRSQTDNASCERDELAAVEQEAAALRVRLARKEADSSTVEAEIQRQIGDYERLKTRLLQQVQMSVCICVLCICIDSTSQAFSSY